MWVHWHESLLTDLNKKNKIYSPGKKDFQNLLSIFWQRFKLFFITWPICLLPKSSTHNYSIFLYSRGLKWSGTLLNKRVKMSAQFARMLKFRQQFIGRLGALYTTIVSQLAIMFTVHAFCRTNRWALPIVYTAVYSTSLWSKVSTFVCLTR